MNDVTIDTARTYDALLPKNVMIGEPMGMGSGHITTSDMHNSIVAHETAIDVLENMKKVPENALCGCIDGRLCVHRMDGQERDLRLSVAGGVLATTYAAFELLGVDLAAGDASSERLKQVNVFLKSCDIEAAGHCDVANFTKNFVTGTGCGAVDKMPLILQTALDNTTTIHQLIQVVRSPRGESIQEGGVAFVPAETLTKRHDVWMPQTAIGDMKLSNVEVLKSEENATHGHAESVVIFNDIENTTLDRDALFESGKQAFDVDVWYLRKIAKTFAEKLDRHDINSDMILDAMIAYQLATYLVLCDGTQRPIFIMPEEK